MQKFDCNECDEQVTLADIEKTVGKEELHDNIIREYFKCPHCNKEYTTHYTNEEIRALQKRMRMVRKMTPMTTKNMNIVNGLKRQAIYLGNKLKKEVEGHE